VESALKPIINDLKQSKGILIKFILSNEYKKLDNIEKFMLKINEIAPIDTVIIFGVYYDDLKVETFKCDILISGLPEN
jgi:cell division GTPase FtsZ